MNDLIPEGRVERKIELERLATAAFDAHSAMILMEVATPALRDNEHWRALRETANARFRAALLAL